MNLTIQAHAPGLEQHHKMNFHNLSNILKKQQIRKDAKDKSKTNNLFMVWGESGDDTTRSGIICTDTMSNIITISHKPIFKLKLWS